MGTRPFENDNDEDHRQNPAPDFDGGYYAIKIKGHLDEQWSDWFGDLKITHDKCGDSTLTGFIADQSALHGILAQIRDLNLGLFSLTRQEPERRIFHGGETMTKETTFDPAQVQERLSWRKMSIIGLHAFIGWALCAATIGIGMALTTEQNALIIHAIGAPIFFAGVSLLYFTKFNYTRPLKTALIFVGFVILVDFFVVALVVLKSFEMFYNPLGTWIPFALIFSTTYIFGLFLSGRREVR